MNKEWNALAIGKKTEEKAAINLENVCCLAGRKPLLQNISWQVKKGDKWLVYGANGSGKTTLLSLLAGYGRIAEGRLQILGMRYTAQTVFSLRKRIGWVSASFFDKYYSKESVADVMLSALSGGLGVRFTLELTDVKTARQILARFDLLHKWNQPYQTLSKGEQQKVLLARAFLQEPEILLLDEPANGLDWQTEQYMKKIITDIAGDSTVTIVYVSHHPYEFGSVFEHCLVLEAGKIKACGFTEKIL